MGLVTYDKREVILKAIIGGLIYYKNKFIKDSYILFDEKIREIGNAKSFSSDKAEEVIHLKNQYLLPGFIDVHIHGIHGNDAMDSQENTLDKIARDLVKHGVTSFLPTTMTVGEEKIHQSLNYIGREMKKTPTGARILGAHLEGPFVSPTYKGAQKAENIQKASSSLLEDYKDVIKIITIAPEIDGAMDLIENYSSDFCFSLGHSDARYDQAKIAFDKGANSVTHLFNAMSGLHHRQPGLVGAALLSDAYVELIADMVHVHPDLFQLVYDLKGDKRILLISDAMRAADMEEGSYEFGGQEVLKKDGRAQLEDGTIAGSLTNMNEVFKNFYKQTNISLADAVRMTARNQAKYLGLNKELGRIKEDYYADLVVLDKNLNVEITIVGGKKVFDQSIEEERAEDLLY